MSTTETFLAIFLGSKTSPRMAAWNSLPEGVRRATMQEGIAAWKSASALASWSPPRKAEAQNLAGNTSGGGMGSRQQAWSAAAAAHDRFIA